jgi:N-acetylmuramic acid 6-phosphate etherase
MDHLQTEARNPASTNLDELPALELARLMNAEDAKIIPAVASQAEAIARAIDLIADRLRAGGRLIYAGAGTSGRLGVLDATECPPTFSAPPGQVIGMIAGGPQALTRSIEGAEDHSEFGERDLQALQPTGRDVVVGIATSGRTPYVLGALACARRLGACTIGLSCNTDADLIPYVDLAILPVVGPEILSGSTRLKAGTATKLVLNMLTTGAMVRLGKTFGNLMVDLKASNQKLRARTNRIVRLLTGLDRQQADDLLKRCDGELKTALVAQLSNQSPSEARTRLQAAGGQVRRALAPLTPHPSPPALGREGEPGASATGVFREPGASATGVFPSSREEMKEGRESGQGLRKPILVLGVDGGGTHTVALLARIDSEKKGGTVLGRGVAGPSNLHAVGKDRALQALEEAIAQAFTAAGQSPSSVAVAWLGLAGAARPQDQSIIRDWAERVKLAAAVEVSADVPLLLAAGTPDGWGAALVAGTGSIAYGLSREGRHVRAGGWGYLMGDEGSGTALTRAGLQAVAWAADGRGPATRLTERFLTHLGLTQAQDLIFAIYSRDFDRASLARLVLEAWEAGDEVAGRIVQQGAEQLAAMVQAVICQLAFEQEAIPLALSGGVLLASQGYRRQVLMALERLSLQVHPVTLLLEPAEGALALALAKVTELNL